jgi:hypothetical protein
VILRSPAERGADERLKAAFLQCHGYREVPGYAFGWRVVRVAAFDGSAPRSDWSGHAQPEPPVG